MKQKTKWSDSWFITIIDRINSIAKQPKLSEAMDKIYYEDKHFRVNYDSTRKLLICTTLSQFIPKDEFMTVFEEMTKLLRTVHLETMIFDKTSLRTFDQPSMSWYHTEWKPNAKNLGLRRHRKILPKDIVFRTSVKVGRSKILKDYPEFRFEDYDIQYFESMEEALTHSTELV